MRKGSTRHRCRARQETTCTRTGRPQEPLDPTRIETRPTVAPSSGPLEPIVSLISRLSTFHGWLRGSVNLPRSSRLAKLLTHLAQLIFQNLLIRALAAAIEPGLELAEASPCLCLLAETRLAAPVHSTHLTSSAVLAAILPQLFAGLVAAPSSQDSTFAIVTVSSSGAITT